MREIRTYGLMRGCWAVRHDGGLGSTQPPTVCAIMALRRAAHSERWADKTKQRLRIQSRSPAPTGAPEGSDDHIVIVERVVQVASHFGHVDATDSGDSSFEVRRPGSGQPH